MSAGQHKIHNKQAVGSGADTNDLTYSINATDGILLPKGTTAQRPTPLSGIFRYNSTLNQIEWYNGTEWVQPAAGGLGEFYVDDTTIAGDGSIGNPLRVIPGAPNGVTSFSAGNLSSLFTTSVANPATTPSLSFALAQAAPWGFFGNNTASAALPIFNAAAAITSTSDTNITLTLGGTPTRAVLNATSITAGWNGQLSLGRGGTGTAMSAPGANRIMYWNNGGGSMDWLQLGTNLSITGNTLNATTSSGSVTSVGLTTGTTGTDINVSNSPITSTGNITLNIPTASASARGLLSSTNWTTFNNKVDPSRTLTINGTTFDLSANRSWSIAATGTVSIVNITTDPDGDGSQPNTIQYNNDGDIFIVDGGGGIHPINDTGMGELWVDETTISGNGTSGSPLSVIFPPTSTGTVTSVGLTTGSTGTDVNITNSPVTTSGNIVLNLPSSSSSNRGLLTSSDWVTFNNKVATSRTLTINGTTFDLSANRSWTIPAGTVTSIGLVTGSTGTDINVSGSPVTGSGNITLNIPSSSASNRGLLTSTDWSNFNSKVPSARTITINGTTLDLTADRSWTIATNSGTVTSVALATGTTGTDVNISGSPITGSGTITLNLPSSSASNRGLLTAANWSTFNGKLDPSRTITINGTTLDLTANRTWTVGTVTSVGLATGSSGTDINVSGSPVTGSGNITLNIPSSSGSNRGLLTSTDWTTFNNKVPTARTLTINGTGYDLSANRSWTIPTGISGTYSPTVTNSVNVSAPGVWNAHYTRIENEVTVFFYGYVSPTSSATLTSVNISLPVASSFSEEYHLTGSATARRGTDHIPAQVVPDFTDDNATITFLASTNSVTYIRGSFMYTIITGT